MLSKRVGTEEKEFLEDDFLQAKKFYDKNIEEIKEEHECDKIKDAFDEDSTTT